MNFLVNWHIYWGTRSLCPPFPHSDTIHVYRRSHVSHAAIFCCQYIFVDTHHRLVDKYLHLMDQTKYIFAQGEANVCKCPPHTFAKFCFFSRPCQASSQSDPFPSFPFLPNFFFIPRMILAKRCLCRFQQERGWNINSGTCHCSWNVFVVQQRRCYSVADHEASFSSSQ